MVILSYILLKSHASTGRCIKASSSLLYLSNGAKEQRHLLTLNHLQSTNINKIQMCIDHGCTGQLTFFKEANDTFSTLNDLKNLQNFPLNIF